MGVDLHLYRSVVVRIDERGRQLDCVQLDNDPKALVREVRKAGRGAQVAIEATYGWYWAVDALQVDAAAGPMEALFSTGVKVGPVRAVPTRDEVPEPCHHE